MFAKATLIVPDGTLNAYSQADGWKEFLNIQEENEYNGVSALAIDDVAFTISIVNDEIIINGVDDAQISVYNLNGGLIYQGENRPVAVTNKGIYIVVVNGKANKLMI